jgi:hypothetical protein
MSGGNPTGQQLVLNMAALLGLSNTTDTLLVAGDAGDQVTAHGAWLAAPSQTIDGTLYNAWTAGSASLLVDTDISVTFT